MFHIVLILLIKKYPLINKYIAVLLLKLHFLLRMVTEILSCLLRCHKFSFEVFLSHHTLNSWDVPEPTISEGLELGYDLVVCL